jgi:FKBP-type peptidyl-prolyl cis-trans isomerase FkpA
MSVTAVPVRPIRKGSVLKLWLGLAFFALLALGAAWIGTSRHIYQTTPSGLGFRVIKEGEGAHPTESDIALVQYTGRLENGRVFDQNTQGAPMPLAPGATIPGFAEGLKLMRKGGVYRLRIPPRLGYGERGNPPAIPPGETLEFDVAMMDFMPEATVRAMQQQMMQQQMMQQQMQGGGGPGGPGGPGAGVPAGPEGAAPQGPPTR